MADIKPLKFRLVQFHPRLRVDDRNAAVAAATHGQSRTVGSEGQIARPTADRDPRQLFEPRQIDHGHLVRCRQRHVGQRRIRRNRDAARLETQVNRAREAQTPGVNLENGQLARVRRGHQRPPPVGRQGDRRGMPTARHFRNHNAVVRANQRNGIRRLIDREEPAFVRGGDHVHGRSVGVRPIVCGSRYARHLLHVAGKCIARQHLAQYDEPQRKATHDPFRHGRALLLTVGQEGHSWGVMGSRGQPGCPSDDYRPNLAARQSRAAATTPGGLWRLFSDLLGEQRVGHPIVVFLPHQVVGAGRRSGCDRGLGIGRGSKPGRLETAAAAVG